MRILFALLCVLPCAAWADIVVATRTIRAQTIVTPADVAVKPGEVAGAAIHPGEVIGKEARAALYAGRPIRLADVGPPAVIERNEIVPLIFTRGGLHIVTEGRSLSRATAGERVRVMNLSSRSTVSGRVRDDGRVFVSD
ncbi:flagellar basal body P-ring formation chaperone FlgA [Roseovarius salis]|uniref:flagellar basal body P-ring formation chaperone FlgA n=1 Tax=Roseovarius salis TaxID=3376063 RepID=UPI0037CAD679